MDTSQGPTPQDNAALVADAASTSWSVPSQDWFASHAIAWLVDGPALEVGAADAIAETTPAVVVAPTHVTGAVREFSAEDGPRVLSVAGYPTGRMHSIMKSSEAHFSIMEGVSEVWMCIDPLLQDENSVLADLITARDACPHPAQVGLILPEALRQCGLLPDGMAKAMEEQAGRFSSLALISLAARAGYDQVVAPYEEAGSVSIDTGSNAGLALNVMITQAQAEELKNDERALEELRARTKFVVVV